ncbi:MULTISPECIES: PTS sugar transporter subunit IIA [Bacillaceae]|uniref:PTS glucose transporter subunit IIA n=1 Tax=Evansella alkalicola TaxID=745819 RepID=A0ABS6K211_9BACI|nr:MULTISPECIES: PTS glucose transporter subunit IIA [Bacillaceae]MBU9724049.1 PTS glucose transporter subunit IIA [Bacillus alkalicola]
MLKKLFGLDKKNEKGASKATGSDIVKSPMTGKVVPLSEVPDPTFSQKMMGDGMAIEPADSLVLAPVDGEVINLFPTKHAIGIKTVNGIEILIHIGIDTVNMKGEGFEAFIKQGDNVKTGDKLIKFDMGQVESKAASTITPLIITNGDAVSELNKEEVADCIAGETTLMTVIKK